MSASPRVSPGDGGEGDEGGGGVLIGCVSDTHIFQRPLPDRILEALEGVDLILHAGDILEPEVLTRLSTVAETIAVAGNMDHGELKQKLPAKLVVEAAGRRIGLIHGSGGPEGITQRVRREFSEEQVDAIVFGHTHEPFNREEYGIYFFNPGSPTDKIFARINSVGILEVGESINGRIVLV